MASPRECREFANESLCWAKTAKSERESAIFLQMAHAWLLAAAKMEDQDVPGDLKGTTAAAWPVPTQVARN